MGFEAYVEYAMGVPMYFVYRDGQYHNALGQDWRDFMEVRECACAACVLCPRARWLFPQQLRVCDGRKDCWCRPLFGCGCSPETALCVVCATPTNKHRASCLRCRGRAPPWPTGRTTSPPSSQRWGCVRCCPARRAHCSLARPATHRRPAHTQPHHTPAPAPAPAAMHPPPTPPRPRAPRRCASSASWRCAAPTAAPGA
jgi:hypothetical protein